MYYKSHLQNLQKVKIMGRTLGVPSSMEAWMMINGKYGETFYTEKRPKDMTAIASYYNRKIMTGRVLIIDEYTSDIPVISRLTKVTLLSK